jgi:hypothetical protein
VTIRSTGRGSLFVTRPPQRRRTPLHPNMAAAVMTDLNRNRLAQILGMTASGHDGQVLNAARVRPACSVLGPACRAD